MDKLAANSDKAISFFSNPNFWIAIYGAILSTILAIRQFLKSRYKIKVTCNLSFTTKPNDNRPWWLVDIKIINTGYRPVTIKGAELLLENGESFVQIENTLGFGCVATELPKKINDGDSIQIYFDYLQVKETLDNFQPPVFLDHVLVYDAEGNRYTGKLPKSLKGKLQSPPDIYKQQIR